MKMFLLTLLLGAAAAVDFGYGPDCDELKCTDRPGTVCQMITFDCTTAPCAPTAECVPKENSCETKKCGPEMTCVVRRAFCTPGDADCKHRPECLRVPKCSEANEEYRECSGERDGAVCESTCEREDGYCPNCGKGGCVCKHGFYRHKGKCIKKDQCPDPECPVNMEWVKCPSTCPAPSCRSILNKDSEICTEGCGWARCMCKPGFVLNDDEVCIKKETCPKTFDCPSPFEVLQQCSTVCEPTCADQNPICTEQCGPPKCQCKPGFVRDSGHCLAAFQCPHIDPPRTIYTMPVETDPLPVEDD